MTRLTEAQLTYLHERASMWREVHHGTMVSVLAEDVQAMVTELRARRAADLSKEDVEALQLARDIVAIFNVNATSGHGENDRALSVLDRILAAHNPESAS